MFFSLFQVCWPRLKSSSKCNKKYIFTEPWHAFCSFRKEIRTSWVLPIFVKVNLSPTEMCIKVFYKELIQQVLSELSDLLFIDVVGTCQMERFDCSSWSYGVVVFGRLGKRELHELRGVQLFKRFSAKFVNFSVKLESLNVQIRNNFKNVIFIACKQCKICKY